VGIHWVILFIGEEMIQAYRISPAIRKSLKTLHKRKDYGAGVSCMFFRLTPKVGIKVYASARRRDHCYMLQKIAAKHGLAPKVGNKIKLSRSVDKYISSMVYGFLTEAVKDPYNISWDCNEICSEFDELEAKLKKIGIKNKDIHEGNISVKNHKTICIDFSHAWMPKIKKYKYSPCANDE